MNLLELLDDSARYKLIVFDLLSLPNQHVSVSYLEEFLGLSTFKVKNILTDLSSDCELHFGSSLFDMQKNGEVTNRDISKQNILELRLNYCKESLKFKLLENVLFHQESLEVFSKKYFIGITKAYALRKELNQFFEGMDLSIKENIIAGPENQIRLFAYSCYYYFFNGIEYPFNSEVKQVNNDILQIIEATYGLQLKRTERNKLELFLSILVQRIALHSCLSNETIIQEETIFYEIKSYFKKNLDLQDDYIQSEWEYLYLFLHMQEIIDVPPIVYVEQKNQEINLLNQTFIQSVKDNIRLIDEVKLEAYLETLAERIVHIHEQLLMFPHTANTFISESQVLYFEENFYLYHTIIQNFINNHIAKQFRQLSNDVKVKLYYDYMFELIRVIPIRQVEEPIYITVDFSHGLSYSMFIADSIRSLNNINVNIDWRVHSKTQLYISDFYISALKCEQIIWKNPPDESDWEDFVNSIVEMRYKR